MGKEKCLWFQISAGRTRGTAGRSFMTVPPPDLPLDLPPKSPDPFLEKSSNSE